MLFVIAAVLGIVLIAGAGALAEQAPVEIGLCEANFEQPSPASAPVVDFGPVRAAESPYIRPLAFQVSVKSSLPWSVSIKAAQDLTGQATEKTLPSERIKWRLHRADPGNWTALTREDVPVRSGNAGEDISMPFDLRLDVLWEDSPGSYQTEIVATLAPEGDLSFAGAFPNPFSPNEDGVNDVTTVSFEVPSEGTYAGDIFDMNGAKVKRFFGPAENLAVGWYTATWDGKGDDGHVVSDGDYAFNIKRIDSSEAEFTTCAGILVVDTVAPPLTIDSPQSGEVGSSVVLSGSTEPEIQVYVKLNGEDLTSLVTDGSGAFSADVDIPPGSNTLQVIAQDRAGNRQEKTCDLTNNSGVVILSPSDDRVVASRILTVAGLGPTSSKVTVQVNGRLKGEGETDASGRWLLPGVTLEVGENTLVAEATNPRKEVIRSLPVTVMYRPTSAGSASIAGAVKDAVTGEHLKGVRVTLFDAGDVELDNTETDKGGAYAFEDLPGGAYKLRVSLVNYVTQATPTFDLLDGESLDRDFTLERNVALDLTKTAGATSIETGQYITYTIHLRNRLSSPITDVIVEDRLPLGMVILPGTVTLNGSPFADPVGDRVLVWEPGVLAAEGTLTLNFKAAAGHDAPQGELVNTAWATASTPQGAVSAGPAEAAVKVSKGIFTDNALVFGCVWLDINANGVKDADEPGIANAMIVMEDGTCVYTDNGGAYSIPSVRPGLHIFRLHSESRPDGFRFADRDTTLVKIAERGTVRLDFPLVPVDGNGNGNGNGYLNGNGNGNGLNSAGIKRLHGMEAPISLLALAEASADGTKAEGNLALCLKAKLGDEAAVTAAVDLKRVKDDPAVSPEKHYATYGDQSRISNLPFVGPLYLALDYKGLSAMYGQYATGFMTGEFGRYPRTLPGILAKYSGDRFFIVAFDSVTEQVLARDEFPADGTCGPFYFRHLPMIRASETVEVITRDKLNPGKIVSTKRLAREADYLTDYDTGRLVLTDAVPSTDGSGNPNSIVATYEFKPVGTNVSHHIVGAHIDCQPYPGLTLAAQYLRHAQEPDPYTLVTFLGTYLPTSRITISGEYALSWGDLGLLGPSPAPGSRAYTLKLNALPLDGVDVSACYTLVEPGFENPANDGEADTARLDLGTRVYLWPRLTLTGSYSVKRDNVIGDVSTPATHERTGAVKARYVFQPSAEASLGYTFKTTSDDLTVHAVDKRLHTWEVSAEKDLSETLAVLAGASWTTEEDITSSSITRSSSQYVGGRGTINDALHATARLSLKAEADEGTDAISRQNTLALGLDYTAGPQFSAQLKAEFPVMESTQGSGTLGLSVACQPLDTLRLGARYDTSLEGAKSLLVLSVTSRVGEDAALEAKYTREQASPGSYSLSLDAGLAYRPRVASRLALFGGVSMKDLHNGTPGNPVLTRTVSGRIEGSYKLTNDMTVSIRYVHRLMSDLNGSDSLSLLTRAATIGAIKDISNAWDIGGSYTLFLEDAEDGRKQVYQIELGYRGLANTRLAVGIRHTGRGVDSLGSPDTRVYLGIGYAGAVGF